MSKLSSDPPAFFFNEFLAYDLTSSFLISLSSYPSTQAQPTATKKTPKIRKAPNMSQPQILPPVPTRNIEARNKLKIPLPTIVLRNLKCLITKLKSQNDMTSSAPNRLRDKRKLDELMEITYTE